MLAESKWFRRIAWFRFGMTEIMIAVGAGLLISGWGSFLRPSLPDGWALRMAAESGDVRTIQAASLEELNRPDSTQTLPIMIASQCGRADAVEAMLCRGVNANTSVAPFGTAMVAAASMGHAEVLRVLIRHGAALDGRDGFGQTALIAAAGCGDAPSVQLLLKAGANPHDADQEGSTALQHAIESQNPECIRLLSSAIHSPA